MMIISGAAKIMIKDRNQSREDCGSQFTLASQARALIGHSPCRLLAAALFSGLGVWLEASTHTHLTTTILRFGFSDGHSDEVGAVSGEGVIQDLTGRIYLPGFDLLKRTTA
jgi:hypothetical protein